MTGSRGDLAELHGEPSWRHPKGADPSAGMVRGVKVNCWRPLHRVPCLPLPKMGWFAVTLSHGKPSARTKGVDNEREHIAAVGVQRPIRIDAGLDQFSAKRQYRRGTAGSVAFGRAGVRADELGADDRRLIPILACAIC